MSEYTQRNLLASSDHALAARMLVVGKGPMVPAPILLGDGTIIKVDAPKFRLVSEDDVVRLLNENDAFVSLAVVVLYDRQCFDEVQAKTTKHDNRVGFNKPDANVGTYYGEWVTGKNVRAPRKVPSFMLNNNRFFLLSGNHLDKARALLHKYRKQITRALNGEMV